MAWCCVLRRCSAQHCNVDTSSHMNGCLCAFCACVPQAFNNISATSSVLAGFAFVGLQVRHRHALSDSAHNFAIP